MGIPDHLTCLLKTCVQVKKQQLELDMKQQTGSKLGKGCVKAVCCHPIYLTYMQSTSFKMSGWKNHQLESRLLGIGILRSSLKPPANVEGNKGFLPQPKKDLKSPSSMGLEVRFPYHGSRAITRSPSPCTWRPDFPGATREAP